MFKFVFVTSANLLILLYIVMGVMWLCGVDLTRAHNVAYWLWCIVIGSGIFAFLFSSLKK